MEHRLLRRHQDHEQPDNQQKRRAKLMANPSAELVEAYRKSQSAEAASDPRIGCARGGDMSDPKTVRAPARLLSDHADSSSRRSARTVFVLARPPMVRKALAASESEFAFRSGRPWRIEVFGGSGAVSVCCGWLGEAHAGAVGGVAEFVRVVRFTVSTAEMLDHRLVVLGHVEVNDGVLGVGERGWFGVVAVYTGGKDVAERGVGCFHHDVAGCLYRGGMNSLPVDGPAGRFEEFVKEDSLRAGVAVSERVQEGGFTPVVGEPIDGASLRQLLGEVAFGDSPEDERCSVFDVFGSAMWEIHADGDGVNRLKAWWTTSPSCPYTAISFASLNERSSRREHRAAILLQPCAQQKQKEPYPASPGSSEPTNIRPSPPSKTVRKQIERFSRRSEAEFSSGVTAGGRAAGPPGRRMQLVIRPTGVT